eukprot:CAMPEP_0184495376 /NCGR_PEP_ID=MMETSP0113_2-20130426/31111_1 /TAXON_ID=91329 /ORGANISM="Norrisiella sphaerica, Strain BC52" /LENGTH=381 /DNA_ID=CAMNT_0026881533 /DNA_START=127 /DNA_END=1272 /DNA_ORIENTATION=+
MAEDLFTSTIGFKTGVVISVMSSLMNSIRPPLQKHLVQTIPHPTLQQSIKGLAQIPIHVIFVLAVEPTFLPTSSRFYAAVAVNAVLNFLAEYLMTIALRIAPLSHTVPFTTLSLPFLVVTSSLILGEYPSRQGVIGVILMCGGAFYLNSVSAAKKDAKKTKEAPPTEDNGEEDIDVLDDDNDTDAQNINGLRRRKKGGETGKASSGKEVGKSEKLTASKEEEEDSKHDPANVRKGTLLALCVACCWSLASPVDKVAMKHCTPLQFTMVNTFLKWCINVMTLTFYIVRTSPEKREEEMKILPGATKYITAAAFAGGVGFCLHVSAANAIPVVYNSALRRCGLIVSVLYGALVFGEHNLVKTLSASSVMIVGVLLIITQPQAK